MRCLETVTQFMKRTGVISFVKKYCELTVTELVQQNYSSDAKVRASHI